MPDIAGHVDGIEGHVVTGWAIADPDRGSCTIEISDEIGNLVGKGRATKVRSDLSVLGRGRTNFGFRVPVKFPPNSRKLIIKADGRELPNSPLAIGSEHWDGALTVSAGRVSGWVSQRSSSTHPAPIITLSGGQPNLTQTFDELQPRHDLGDSAWGFDTELSQIWYGFGSVIMVARVNGIPFAQTVLHLRLDGFLDRLTLNRCSGWLVSPDAVKRNFVIELLVNGKRARTVHNDVLREDLQSKYGSARLGFDIEIPSFPEASRTTCEISIRLAGSTKELFGGPFILGSKVTIIDAARKVGSLAHTLESLSSNERAILQEAIQDLIHRYRFQPEPIRIRGYQGGGRADPTKVSIIIPVYRGVSVTRECIESVLLYTPPGMADIIVINDCSPEPDMATMLKMFAQEPRYVVLTNDSNLGFVKSVNRALQMAICSDVVLLNSDTRVHKDWLATLQQAAYSSPEIGTATAMSNNATIFSYPHPILARPYLEDITWAKLADVAAETNSTLVVDVPTGHGFCLYIKHQVLARLGALDEKYGRGYGEENDYCSRAADLGYRHVAATGTFVEHRERVSFGADRGALWEENRLKLEAAFPEYTGQIIAHELRDPLRVARWPLDQYRLRHATQTGKKFIISIINNLEGGSRRAANDVRMSCGSEYDWIEVTALGGDRLSLSCDEPLIQAVFTLGEESKLFALIQSADPVLLVCHQLLGFSADFFTGLRELSASIPAIYYVHDFYPICPRVTLIDAAGRFCNIPDDIAICERCTLAEGGHESSLLTPLTVFQHREAFEHLLNGFECIVAPSANTAEYVKRVFPSLAIEIIPHPKTGSRYPAFPRQGSTDNIVILGAIGNHKGAGLLCDVVSEARLTHPNLQFRVIGYTARDDELRRFSNVRISGRYREDELPSLISSANARFALFLSQWPETFSYTLSEVAQHGLIPIVPDIGAPADRVRQSGYGFVYQFPADAKAVLAAVDEALATKLKSSPRALHRADKPAQKMKEVISRALRNNLRSSPHAQEPGGSFQSLEKTNIVPAGAE